VTTLTNYRSYHEVLVRVEQVRSRMRTLAILEGLFTLVTVLCGTLLLVTLAQGYLRFGPVGRLILLVVGVGVFATAFWRCVVVPLRYDPNDKEVARFLETRLPELGNSLINTILLAEEADTWSGPLVQRAIDEASSGSRGVNLASAVSEQRARRWGLAACGALALFAAFVVLAFGRFTSAGLQILMPFSQISSVGAVRFLSVTPGNADWIKGEPLVIEAQIADPKGTRYDGEIEITGLAEGQAERKALLCSATGLDRFTYRVPQVLEPFTYQLHVGGTESREFRVALKEPPLIERIDVVYHYPEYTGLQPQTVENNGGEVRCLVGTRVEWRAHVSSAVEAATLLFGSGEKVPCLAGDDGRSLTGRFTVLKDGTYEIHLDGQAPGGAAVVYRVKALEDGPPVVQFTVPARDVAAAVGDTVKMSLKAADRYGVAQIRLLAQAEGQEEPQVLRAWTTFADPKDTVVDHGLHLAAAEYREGQTVTYWAEAQDGRTYQGGDSPRGPNAATTAKYKILLQDKAAAAAQRLGQLSRLFDRLREILKQQVDARTAADPLAGMQDADAVRTAGGSLRGAQDGIRQGTRAVIRDVEFDAETAPIRETLEVLSVNEMASAVRAAGAVADLGGPEPLAQVPRLAGALVKDQDAIIAVLRRILDITGRLADAVKDEEQRLAASDMPDDTLDDLKELRDRLKDFLDEQKKVIEASKELAKRPVDDYTETDQRELERLKAIEDQWDKFLTEAIADFSKVPEVDSSNPSLCKELIEVKTDVEMAADALAKKAMDIVVPLEELGMEGAEEIVENLERWLPDTPDREAWSQEDFTGDYEIPHAELPEQLEDLVGDLLEQEEDLFEEMDDVTSNAGDSLDKGAGWDAMDGPISNFSAKGVTGNRLPNTSEISGRSGEGRTGKASGEFVEETATGKGGRRTPTRLSPDDFSKGEIKDTSAEAPTGATGGGKISGAGQEGLEGPVPPEVQRRMGALAGKQAQLRNKAEGVKAGLKVRNYESFTLDRAIGAMRRVERDLLAGRYHSAMRRRDVVLENLKGTKMLVTGEMRVRRDTSAALPTEVQKDVLDALEKPMPRGYEEYLKRYYTRLSEGD
jgi:hypothetical protein